MGLDMYLTAKKYAAGYAFCAQKKQDLYVALIAIFGLPADWNNGASPLGDISLTVAYWRKSNAVHDWFVRETQDGNDDCEESYVSKKQLQDLIECCQKIIEQPELGPKLLPTKGGFFFGDTTYSQYYIDDLRDTVKQITEVLNNPAFEDCDFYYRASW